MTHCDTFMSILVIDLLECGYDKVQCYVYTTQTTNATNATAINNDAVRISVRLRETYKIRASVYRGWK